MNLRSQISLTLLITSVAFFDVNGQTKKEFTLVRQSELSVEVFRGIIEIFPSQRKKISVEETIYNYASYRKNKELTPVSGNSIVITESDKEVKIQNVNSEQLHFIRISVPPEISLKIHAHHYGEITLHDLNNVIQAETYEGKISGTISNTISANIVRNGNFEITSRHTSQKKFIMLSGYTSNINLTIENRTSASFRISTDLGQFKSDLNIPFEETQGRAFNLIDPQTKKTTILHEKTFSGSINRGRDQINIRNIHGEIKLLKDVGEQLVK